MTTARRADQSIRFFLPILSTEVLAESILRGAPEMAAGELVPSERGGERGTSVVLSFFRRQ
jgi:hypothetical protein